MWPCWSGSSNQSYIFNHIFNQIIMAKIKTDAQYQAEWDADTMARYQEIISDSKRKAAAMKAARQKAADLQKSYNNMSKVAKTGRKK